jgi:hypothetical protein
VWGGACLSCGSGTSCKENSCPFMCYGPTIAQHAASAITSTLHCRLEEMHEQLLKNLAVGQFLLEVSPLLGIEI